jgi:HAD superfamily hydrolase (TIGR01509 family)
MNKLIIFDCDGVLVDSEIICSRIFATTLTELGYKISLEDSIRKFTGMSDKTVRQYILDETGLALPENLTELTSKQILKALEVALKPLMLSILKMMKQKNIKICVASSSPRQRVLRSLEITKQNYYFQDDYIFTSAQVKNGKPAPDLFLFAAKQMGYQPKDCLVIEDSIAGIQAALAANMKVIGFLAGSHTNFNWYKERVQGQKVPIAHNTNELATMIMSLIN